MKKPFFFSLLFTFCCFCQISAQVVTGVDYLMEYNDTTDQYDIYIHINNIEGGDAVFNAVQGNATVTVAAIKGFEISIPDTTYNPIQAVGSQVGQPIQWNFVLTNTMCPEWDYYQFTPKLSPQGRYSQAPLEVGSKVKLFSVSQQNTQASSCQDWLRLFENANILGNPNPDADPTSSHPCMSGGDLSNGFHIGSPNQLYQQNLEPINPGPVDPEVAILGTDQLCNGLTTQLYPSSGGAWISQDPSVVSVDPYTGLATAISQGWATCEWTNETTGCTAATTPIIVDPAPFTSCSLTELCIGGQATLFPGLSLGTWTAIEPAIASVGNDGTTITTHSGGTARFLYEESATGCNSDTMYITVHPNPETSITGPDEICIGANTTLSPTGGGTWVSNNAAVAVVANNGVVTGISYGYVCFSFSETWTGCISDPICISILPPDAGPDQKVSCYETGATYLQAEGTGSWILEAGAGTATIENSINPQTKVSGFSTPGEYTFTFSTSNICQESATITVGDNCTCTIENNLVVPPSTNKLCPSSILTLESQADLTGGDFTCQWEFYITNEFENPLLLSEEPIFEYSSATPGTKYLRKVITSLTDNCKDTSNIIKVEVLDVPNDLEPMYNGPLCIGEDLILTADLVPLLTYEWYDPSGLVYNGNQVTIANADASNAGLYTLKTTNDIGCLSMYTLEVMISPQGTIPQVSVDTICLDTEITVESFGAEISYSNDIVEPTSEANVFRSVGCGEVTFSTVTDGCESFPSDPVYIRCPETEFDGPQEVCVANFTKILSNPITTGVWASTNPAVATVNNSGIIICLSPGTASFIFTDLSTGCESLPSEEVMCKALPLTTLIGPSEICPLETTQFEPSSGGNWISETPIVATINNAGVVTCITPGTTRFIHTDLLTGCQSEPSDYIICLDIAEAEITGPQEICVGQNTQLSPNTGGTWVSSNPSVAFVVATTGVATGLSPGTATFKHTRNDNACMSYPTEILTVVENHELTLTGPSDICIGESTTVTSAIDGIWKSSSPAIATISNSGVIQGLNEGSVTITLEGPSGCNSSESELITIYDCEDPCQDLYATETFVYGIAYVDANENGIFDTGEQPLQNINVSIDGGNNSLLTDANGYYEFYTTDGDYTITAMANLGTWVEDQLTADVMISGERCIGDLDFGFVLAPAPPEVEVSVSSYLTRCDTEVRFFVDYTNIGSEPLSGAISLTFDDLTSYVSSVGGSLSGNTVTWEVENLNPLKSRREQIKLLMPEAQQPFPIMDFVAVFSEELGGDSEPYTYSSQLRCSYDPNDKSVQPLRVENENKILFDEDLLYTIRFQNNGNDTAFLVTIVDELEPSISPSSVRVRSSSHPVTTSIAGQLLTFTFADIFLVDSMTNYEASQGYVTFSCKTVNGIDENTPLLNKADIIFDTNPPIITNTVENTLVSNLCLDDYTSEEFLTICEGESYLDFEETGTYTLELNSTTGCDSFHIINLDVITQEIQEIEIDLCPGKIAIFNGQAYSEGGSYADTIVGNTGCITDIFDITITQLEEDDPACAPTSVEDNGEAISVFPNPTQGELYIAGITDIKNIQILTLDASSVYSLTSIYEQGTHRVDVRSLPTGIYIICIHTERTSYYEKVIIL